MADAHQKLGIIAGSGRLPRLILDAAGTQFGSSFTLAFHEDTPPETVEGHAHQWLSVNEIARTIEIFRQQGITHIVMAGRLSRPSLKGLKPPLLSAKIVARLGKALFAGDDALFTAITRIFEEEGFTVIGADDILKELLTPAGNLTDMLPNEAAERDLERGIELVYQIGKLDIGQGLVIKHGQVLGVEALEGTDAMIERCATLGDPHEKGGVLIKAKKPEQERRVDLPAIGPQTVENMAKAGLQGIAVEAEGSLIIDREATLRAANKHGIFIVGFERPHE